MKNRDSIISLRETLTLDDMIVIAHARYKQNIYAKVEALGLDKLGYTGSGLGRGILSYITKWIRTPNSYLYRIGEALYFENPEIPPGWFKGSQAEWQAFFLETFDRRLLAVQDEKSETLDEMPYSRLADIVFDISDRIPIGKNKRVSDFYVPTQKQVELLVGIEGCHDTDKKDLANNLRYFMGKKKTGHIYNQVRYKMEGPANLKPAGTGASEGKKAMPVFLTHESKQVAVPSQEIIVPKAKSMKGPLDPGSPYAGLLKDIGVYIHAYTDGFELPYSMLNEEEALSGRFFNAIGSLRRNYNFLEDMIRLSLAEICLDRQAYTIEHDIPLTALIAIHQGESAYHNNIIDDQLNLNLEKACGFYGISDMLDISKISRRERYATLSVMRQKFLRFREIREAISSVYARSWDHKLDDPKGEISRILDSIRDFLLPGKLSGRHDESNAFVTIIVPETDWFTQRIEKKKLLEDAYSNFAGLEEGIKPRWSVTIIDGDSEDNTMTLHIKGKYAYGLLKGEDAMFGNHVFKFDEKSDNYQASVRVRVEPEIEKKEYVIKKGEYRKKVIESNNVGGRGSDKKGSLQLIHNDTGISVKIRSRHHSMQEKEEYGLSLLTSKVAAFYETNVLPDEAEFNGGTLRSYTIQNGSIVGIIDNRDLNVGLKLSNKEIASFVEVNQFPFIYAFHDVYFG